jgi:RNA polymerase sigma factor (sigma-70 family)
VSPEADGLLRILETHGAELHALLTRLTLRTGVAEDLLQELFLKLSNATGFHLARDRKAYAFRAAMHLAFDWRRKQRAAGSLATEPAASADSALDRLIHAEELEQVLDAIQTLPGLSREVLVLRHLRHLDYAEIARELGKTEHQARALYAKALGQLRVILSPVVCEPGKRGTGR